MGFNKLCAYMAQDVFDEQFTMTITHLPLLTRQCKLEFPTNRTIHYSHDPQLPTTPRYWLTSNGLDPVSTKFYFIATTIYFLYLYFLKEPYQPCTLLGLSRHGYQCGLDYLITNILWLNEDISQSVLDWLFQDEWLNCILTWTSGQSILIILKLS